MLLTALLGAAGSARAAPSDRPLPAFTHTSRADWLNSAPLTVADLKGHVTLVDFWAFECWNCYHTTPWLNALNARYQTRGLTIVSVHTPELPIERQRDRLLAKVDEFHIENPVMIDNDGSYWRALGNQYWPAFYLIDRQGIVRDVFVGETHAGDRRARAIEARIDALLAESP
ncbi:redoxin family protein [Solimonas marina]|nr:redoxin family protein [Solimonas marina]